MKTPEEINAEIMAKMEMESRYEPRQAPIPAMPMAGSRAVEVSDSSFADASFVSGRQASLDFERRMKPRWLDARRNAMGLDFYRGPYTALSATPATWTALDVRSEIFKDSIFSHPSYPVAKIDFTNALAKNRLYHVTFTCVAAYMITPYVEGNHKVHLRLATNTSTPAEIPGTEKYTTLHYRQVTPVGGGSPVDIKHEFAELVTNAIVREADLTDGEIFGEGKTDIGTADIGICETCMTILAV